MIGVWSGLTALLILASPAAAGELVFEGGDQRMDVASTSVADVVVQDIGKGLSRVDLSLSQDEAEKFAHMTSQLVGEQLTMSVCGIVVAEPHIMAPITGGHISITGSREMMADIAQALTAARNCDEIGS